MPRGRPPAHTREQVVDAAIRIADVEGLAAVTMRRIAQELGAGAMSLYTYVPDKDRLIDLMVDRVSEPSGLPAVTGDWRTDLIALAKAQRTLMLAHPWLPSALPNRRLTGRNMLAYLERGLACLAPAGLDGPAKLEIIALTTAFVASFVTAEHAGATPPEENVALITEAVAGGEFPELAAALAEGGREHDPRPGFDRIADWMITGLVTQALAAT
ncbi:MAG: TetR/AcrR family transcriptional regulator C-terminal domain-containing protein [Actinomycetota bacterium]|nr:TetR/AcrR family transcriptional regulator C-terminal domain-containing protein [Actinomycetota bacterium]